MHHSVRVTEHYTGVMNPSRVLISSVRGAGGGSLKNPVNKQPLTNNCQVFFLPC